MRILIFSGTTEGRTLAERLHSSGIDITVRVATEYGATVMDNDVDVDVGSCGGAEGIASVIESEGYDIVIDATHPYARTISQHISEACEVTGAERIRLLRDGGSTPSDMIEVPSVEAAIDYLMDRPGTIFASTGSNELQAYTRLPDYKERVVARILSTRASMEKALELGFEGKNLIAAQGPFTEEENYSAIVRSGSEWLVTKDSGTVGGFEDKVRATRRAGAKLVLISRPHEEGRDMCSVLSMLSDRLGVDLGLEDNGQKRRVTIIGIGMGPGDLTQRAAHKLDGCDLVTGAKRMLESIVTGADTFEEYRADEILEHLGAHPEYRDIVCLVSGDTGFYSATTKMLEKFDESEFDVEVECGISSVVYLASKLGVTWQDAYLTSAHGRDSNLVGLCNTHHKVFTLMTGQYTVHSMCSKFVEYGMDVEVAIGEDFGYPTERIVRGSPAEMLDREFGPLCVAMIFNEGPDRRNPLGIPDEKFIRGDAPMTKSEIRMLSVAKLGLEGDSIVYDIGAGTGSVSIEMGLVAVNGRVYAIECEDVAADLIEVNKLKFRADNVEVIRGLAPEAMGDLPAPTHAFIGGSSGNLKQIVKCLIDKNPDIRMVINSVTLETMAETMEVVRELGLVEEEISCINVSKSRKAGRYHLMTAQNPVYIAVVRGR